MSVAAVGDLTAADVNEATGGEVAKIMQVPDVEKLIENALGLDLSGRDSLKVVEARFYRPAEIPDEPASNWPRYISIARQGSLGIMAICALLVLRIFGGGKKKAGLAAKQLPAGGAAGLLAEGAEPAAMRRQIADTLRSNPEQAKQLFATWLQEKGE